MVIKSYVIGAGQGCKWTQWVALKECSERMETGIGESPGLPQRGHPAPAGCCQVGCRVHCFQIFFHFLHKSDVCEQFLSVQISTTLWGLHLTHLPVAFIRGPPVCVFGLYRKACWPQKGSVCRPVGRALEGLGTHWNPSFVPHMLIELDHGVIYLLFYF